MDRVIPGSLRLKVANLYTLKVFDFESFSKLFIKLPTYGKGPLPHSGGTINENAMLLLPNQKRFYGLSYRGDLEGWRRKVSKCCDELGLLSATIADNFIKLSNGEVYPLSECIVELDEVK